MVAGRQRSKSSGADGETVAIIAEGIGVVGSTEKGDHVGLELLLAAGDKVSVLFPSTHFQKLMAALMAAGSAAHRNQLAWLGSEQAAASHAGAQPFVPTSWSIGRASTREGIDVLMVRFEKDQTPVLDLAFTAEAAEQLVLDISKELSRGAPGKSPLQ
ncbi:hypothetical protein [uncultured Phenylobacterium sp.]|uniref:hypothetical protein n=1 Tax=uncultured Phenylobacterium sp. TaxID=349273 RepID=UPI0025F2ECF6|nr:hypothetical protein [uncultured Phenylobacterium sp.]